MKSKKIIRSLILGAAIVAPASIVISCGTNIKKDSDKKVATPATGTGAKATPNSGAATQATPNTGAGTHTSATDEGTKVYKDPKTGEVQTVTNPQAGAKPNTGGGQVVTAPQAGATGNTGGGQVVTVPQAGATGNIGGGQTVTAPQAGPTGNAGGGQVVTAPVQKVNGAVVSSEPFAITDDFGKGNLADPELTQKLIQRNLMEYKTRKLTGQPYALHYHVRDVEIWKPGADADDAFNTATVPLQDRVLAGKILATQKDKQLQILASLSSDTSQSKLGTVSRSDSDQHVFQMWNKVTSFVGWGGSSSEGEFLVPKGDDINAAHRNGVPLLGTAFFGPTSFGGSIDNYAKMVKKNPDGSFPVADSMVAMAQHFGFDGWFLNLESGTIDANTKPQLHKDIGDFLTYLHTKMEANKLFSVLYGASTAVDFIKDPTKFSTADLDYNTWSDDDGGIDPKLVSHGYNYDTQETKTQIKPIEGQNLWLYTYFKHHGITDGDEKDMKLFSDVDGSRDPRSHMLQIDSHMHPLKELGKTLDSLIYNRAWVGLSHYFQAHTTITTGKPFSTSFETGIGAQFFIDGQRQDLQSGFRNQGLQDLLPTYTWISDEYDNDKTFDVNTRVSTVGEKIEDNRATGPWKVQIDEDGTPYYGSSNLHYTGRIGDGKTIINRLYGSQAVLKENDQFSVVVDDTQADTKLALWLQDTLDTDVVQEHADTALTADSTKDLGNGLTRLTYKVPKTFDGKTMISFGLAFTNNTSSDLDINTHVGQLSYTPVGAKPIDKTNEITSLTQDGNFDFGGTKNIRFNWDMKDKAAVDHYVIWDTENGFDKKTIVSITSLPAAFIEDVDKLSKLNYVIDAVDANNDIISSNKITVKTTW